MYARKNRCTDPLEIAYIQSIEAVRHRNHAATLLLLAITVEDVGGCVAVVHSDSLLRVLRLVLFAGALADEGGRVRLVVRGRVRRPVAVAAAAAVDGLRAGEIRAYTLSGRRLPGSGSRRAAGSRRPHHRGQSRLLPS
jgi:hypothetical protein